MQGTQSFQKQTQEIVLELVSAIEKVVSQIG